MAVYSDGRTGTVFPIQRSGNIEQTADCPLAARAAGQVISLPLSPHTTSDQCEYICLAVKQSLVEA